MQIQFITKQDRAHSSSAGFTLPEVLVSVLLLALFAVANFYALAMARVQMAKDGEYGIAVDFVVHYIETVKGLEFAKIEGGAPINELYDGNDGSAHVVIHETSDWASASTEDYLAFHPELTALQNPEVRVTLTTLQVGGADHTKTIQAELRWDPPLGVGEKLSVHFDTVRVMDR